MSSEIQTILQTHKRFTKERNWDQFQNSKNLVMALSVEAAELVEIFTWLTEKQALNLKDPQHQAAKEELADIFIYLLRVADTLGIDLVEAIHEKMVKNSVKYPVEKGLALAKALLDEN